MKRSLIVKICTVAVILGIAACMFVIGRGHTVYFDAKPIEYNGCDLNATLGLILQTLSDVSQKKYYGATILIDVLRGSQNKRVLSDGLDDCKGYGKLAGVRREDVQFLVEWLIENEYIRQTRGPYPVLHPTYNGEHYGEVITRQKLQALKRKLEDTEFYLED